MFSIPPTISHYDPGFWNLPSPPPNAHIALDNHHSDDEDLTTYPIEDLADQGREPLFGGGKSMGPRPFSAQSRTTAATLPYPEHIMNSPAASEHNASDDDAFDGASVSSDGHDAHDPYKQMLEDEADHSQFHDYDDDATRYQFRPTRNTALPSGGTWLDNDASGNYDPDRRGSTLEPRLPKRRKRRHIFTDDRDDHGHDLSDRRERAAEAKRARTYLSARQNGDRLLVKLNLKFDAGMQWQRNPDLHFPVPPEYTERWNFLDREDFFHSNNVSSDEQGPSSYHLRHRGVIQDEIEIDPNVVLGHPDARGCKSCYSVGDRCPMLDPDGIYPCYHCIEEQCDCEPLVEPPKKRACEHCKKRRMRCSYQDSDDLEKHKKPCEGCQATGYRCIAGPKIDPTRTRIGKDGRPATIIEKEPNYKRVVKQPPVGSSQVQGRYLTCERCRQEGLRCGLRKIDAKLPCQPCKTADADCSLHGKTWNAAIPVAPRDRHKNRLAPAAGRPVSSGALDKEAAEHFRNLAVSAAAQDSPPRQYSKRDSGIDILQPVRPVGKVKVIRTRLFHPLECNSEWGCRWCEDPLYGLLGTGAEARVQVRFSPDGKYCTEMRRAVPLDPVGEPGSKMCFECTNDRVLIFTCSQHKLRPIPSSLLDIKINDAMEVLDQSQLGMDRRAAASRFCTICPSLATKVCCTGGSPGDEEGCGLRFCETCSTLFVDLFDRDLGKMVEQVNGDDVETYSNGLRADVDLLSGDSFLVKQVLGD